MGTVSVRELRQNLSVYLRRVAAGETLAVTNRGERVAVLGPLPDRVDPLERLVAERGASAPALDLLDLGDPLPATGEEGSTSRRLARQRAERREPG